MPVDRRISPFQLRPLFDRGHIPQQDRSFAGTFDDREGKFILTLDPPQPSDQVFHRSLFEISPRRILIRLADGQLNLIQSDIMSGQSNGIDQDLKLFASSPHRNHLRDPRDG